MTPDQFNDLYWAAQPPEVRALRDMPRTSPEDADARYTKAVELATKGFVIDTQIHAEGLEPWATMWLRLRYGYTWVPSILQVPNFDLAPGISGMPGDGYDPHNPMPGSIAVSLEADDYPAYEQAPPVVVATPPAKPGPALTATIRSAVAGENSPSGTVWVDENGAKWVKVAVRVPFGWHVWWEYKGV